MKNFQAAMMTQEGETVNLGINLGGRQRDANSCVCRRFHKKPGRSDSKNRTSCKNPNNKPGKQIHGNKSKNRKTATTEIYTWK